MVYINKLEFENLYSYSEGNSLELSKNHIIVGPNNSGKSNIFRIIKLLQNAFSGNHSLSDSEIFPNASTAFLNMDITLSSDESDMLVKHMSFYPTTQNNSSRFYEFQSFEKISELFRDMIIRLTWKKSLHRKGYEPFIELKFTKTGLNFFGKYWPSYFMISNASVKSESSPHVEGVQLHEFLDAMINSKDAREYTNRFFNDHAGKFLKIESIRKDANYEMPDKGREIFQDIIQFLDIDENSPSETAFFQILGKILENGIKTTRGGLNLNQVTMAELAKRIRFELDSFGRQDPNNQKTLFNQTLETQALKKDLEFVNYLRDDGSNIAQFLFSLRNSPKIHDREKYRIIKKTFEELCLSESLELDVVLDYDIERKTKWRDTELVSEPRFPKIIITNTNTRIHYSIDKIGAGISEILYLITTSYGLENTVILMDEPSVNLHPTKAKEVMRKIAKFNSNNQFLIITHSPELTHIAIFENYADICYVRKTDGISKMFVMKKEIKDEFDEERGRLKHQIDSRVFFGKCVILCEGESDRNLFGIVDYLATIDKKYDLAANDVLITSVGGDGNFPKYSKLLSSLGIQYVILADIQAKRYLPESFATMTKDGITGDSNVIAIEGDLEDLMNEIDGELYSKIKSEVGRSKPTVAFEFAKKIHERNPEILKPIKEFLLLAVEKSKQ